jgi:hypothetical protein
MDKPYFSFYESRTGNKISHHLRDTKRNIRSRRKYRKYHRFLVIDGVSARNEAGLERPEKQKDFIAVSKPSRNVCLWFRKCDQCKCLFLQNPSIQKYLVAVKMMNAGGGGKR